MEFAVVAPLLFLLLFGLIDFGWVISQTHDLRAVANVGVRTASVNDVTGTTPAERGADLIAQVAAHATQLTPSSLEVKVGVEDTNGDSVVGNAGDYVVVCLRYPANSLSGFTTPFMPNRLETKAVMRLERDAEFSAGESTSPVWTGGACTST